MTSGATSETEQRPPEAVGPLLRTARTVAGLSQMAVVKATSLSQAALSRIERGHSMPILDPAKGVDQVTELAELYGLDDATAIELGEVVADYYEAARDERITVTRATNILSVQRRIRRREEQTTRMRSFSSGLPFGSTQTPEYAAAVFRTDVDSPRVRDRLRRAVDRPENAHRRYELVLGDGGLRWVMGSAQVMADQCDRLVEVSRLSNVDLRVITPTVVPGIPPGPSFHVHDDGPVVLTQVDGQSELGQPHQVDRYVQRFERLQAVALAGDEALTAIVALADDYRRAAGGHREER